MSGASEFDLTSALPTGVTVLEASAGTGKTYTIAALATRFIAQGASLDELLLVTFTRAATGELRERVRERLVSTERELSRVLADFPPTIDDEVVAMLRRGPIEAVKLRRNRLAQAISGFDSATIETTHGFCQKVLDELGTLGDLEPDVTFVENVDRLVEEVVDDLYLRAFVESVEVPITREQARRIARIAIDNPTAPVYPLAAPQGSDRYRRRRLALSVREELERRKRRLALMTFDDQLTRLRATLAGANGPAAIERLRDRYRYVLIDEFQDTDPIQWEIVERAFAGGEVTLVLIADPKQAIYAFRGADVYAYLQAAETASARATLGVNHRSDQLLLDGFDALFGDARLGHPQIAYRRVRSAPANQRPRLHGAPSRHALRIRVVDRLQESIELTPRGWASAASVRDHIARDVAGEMVALLSSQARIERRSPAGETLAEDPVAPGDVAVLVPTRWTAGIVHRELVAAGVPAVIAGAGSVFATDAAEHWEKLLGALERPASPPRARAAALTPFIGWDATRVATADEDELEQLHLRLHSWARVLRDSGVAALTASILSSERVPARLLTGPRGERQLTDLGHVGQLLHAAAGAEQLGLAALTGWLRERIAAASREGAGDELTRRLESDTAAVQVLTIHRSKGLEFPVVHCPFLWDSQGFKDDWPVYFHDADSLTPGSPRAPIRAIDVALEGDEYRSHVAAHQREERGEDLRLAYVALTRARHQAVLWWAGSFSSRDSALTRLLFAQDGEGNVDWRAEETPTDERAFARFGEIAARAPAAVSVEWSRPAAGASWGAPATPPDELRAARFGRRLDPLWRRTSYTAITTAAHDALVGSEPEDTGIDDEPTRRLELAPPSRAEQAELPLATMATGTRVGTLVHRALERVDFNAGELESELTAALADAGGIAGASALGCEPRAAAAGLASALATPLGGALEGLALTSVRRPDRLDELAFELPLAGGDEPVGAVGLTAIATLLDRQLPAGDPLAGYGERLRDPTLGMALRGYLTGTIDLVLRVWDADGHARYAVIDYKTNWLAAPGENLTAWHYRPEALIVEMQRSHYALQALLYAVALHRYLRWRVPGYDPDVDLLGIHYLFLRGMSGAGDGSGVFSWRPPAGLIAALSDLMAGGEGS